MEPKSTIEKIFINSRKIIVPSYQRAYSWDSPKEKSSRVTQTDVFINDLEDYIKSNTKLPYYFGHFLFEEKEKDQFNVIDGQQRLTTIVIFLSALFKKLKTIRPLTEKEEDHFDNCIKKRSNIHFETVDYDNLLFKDYIIEQTKKDKNGIETESGKRIVRTFDYFNNQLLDKDEVYLTKMLDVICNAISTTHVVADESEAIQMFIFQNNRGKKPTNLEIIKAQFMYQVHLYGGDETESIIKDIKDRFEKIYKSISSIEYKLSEDDVLNYTLQVYFNTILEISTLNKINKELSKPNSLIFVKDFTRALATSFEHLTKFFGKDERENIAFHSLITLGGFSIAIPFILKAYRFGLDTQAIGKLCIGFEAIILRNRLVGTRADMAARLQNTYVNFKESNIDINPIIDKIDELKTAKHWWWAHWNNVEFSKSLQGKVSHATAKFLLWKYETHLETQGNKGYVTSRFDKVFSPELEHIAPSTEPKIKPHGYGVYNEEFKNQYQNCLGNYLLLSKSHNCSISNDHFSEKLKTYTDLKQQNEISQFVSETKLWDNEAISKRKEKIVTFITDNF